jgi:hypothetical protein
MTKFNSDGEVFGTKALTLAVIATSAFILAGMVYSPSQLDQKTAPSVQTQQIVDTVHTTASGVSG